MDSTANGEPMTNRPGKGADGGTGWTSVRGRGPLVGLRVLDLGRCTPLRSLRCCSVTTAPM